MAAAFSTSCVYTELAPNTSHKEIIVETPASFAFGDEVNMTLEDHGIEATGVIAVQGYEMSGTYGVILSEVPRTGVYDGVLVISTQVTVGAPAKKIFRVIGRSS